MRKLLSLLMSLLVLPLAGCPGLGEVLRSYGFIELKPPSKLFSPGTIVWVSSMKPFSAGIICTADRAMGADFQAQESPTMNRSLQRSAKKGVNLTVDIQQIASGNVNLDDVESITMHLKNAKLTTLTDADIADLAYKRRDARCIRAVQLRQQAGFKVTMISEALQADVDYTVNWTRAAKLSAQAKVAALQQLGAQLGLDANNSTDKTMSGTGLFFGVRDDQFLSYLWLPEELPKVQRNSMVFDPNDVADTDDEHEDAAEDLP